MSDHVSAFTNAASKKYIGFTVSGMFREGAENNLPHVEMPGSFNIPDIYINQNDFYATVGRFMAATGTLMTTNAVLSTALQKCSDSTKQELSILCEKQSFSWVPADTRAIDGKTYSQIYSWAKNGIFASLDFASRIIQVLRAGQVGTDDERKAAAQILLDAGYRPIAPKWSVKHHLTDLHQIAGVVSQDATRVTEVQPAALPAP